jgi:hypothetical protein
MPIPSPKERPDIYDDYDGRPEGISPEEKEYWDRIVPDHIKEALAAKAGKKPDEAQPAEPAAQNNNPA